MHKIFMQNAQEVPPVYSEVLVHLNNIESPTSTGLNGPIREHA